MVFDYALQRVGVITIIENFFGRKRNVVEMGVRGQLVKHDELATLTVRQRTEQDAVDDAENRRVDTDAEREGQDGSKGEARILKEDPQPVTNILKSRFNCPAEASVLALFLDLLNSAEVANGGTPSILR